MMMRHYKWLIGTIMTKALAGHKNEGIGLDTPTVREAQNTYAQFKRQSRNYGFSMVSWEDEYFASGTDAQGHYRTLEFDKRFECFYEKKTILCGNNQTGQENEHVKYMQQRRNKIS